VVYQADQAGAELKNSSNHFFPPEKLTPLSSHLVIYCGEQWQDLTHHKIVGDLRKLRINFINSKK
tara:strand:- start:403 stop:597 length:195 start_codon:yes stop_codon:yes gene_type:complete